jgi:membrane-anchored protein YejM (alkaline phosphatase superfamily)
MTGKLPTGFSASRRNPALSEPLSLLLQNGYQFSTSEAESLDWYDTAETIFAGHAVRHIVNAPNDSDKIAIQKSIETIQEAQQTNLPFFHVTYLDGTHFPYSDQGISPDAALIDQYHAALKIMDKNIGTYLNTLETAGVFENTIVILTSDHGEEILENGFIGHSSRLSNEQVQVPMIILGPSKYQPKTVLPKSHSDIMPYLLNTLGIKHSANNKDHAIILANCDYDYPNGFAVIKDKKRADFIYEDGYLYNDNTPGSNMSKDEITEATKILIKQLNR